MLHVFVLLSLLLAWPIARASPLDDARNARAALGRFAWARVIEIENTGRERNYPARFPALVLEAAGRLWLYVPGVGTESLSIYAGRLAADMENLQPLLHEAHAGFTAHRVIDSEHVVAPARAEPRSLPDGCFVAAIAHWRALDPAAADPSHAQLVAIYPRQRRAGHTVLFYEREGQPYLFDPDRSAKPIPYPERLARDPETIARFVLRSHAGLSLRLAKGLALAAPARPSGTLAARATSGGSGSERTLR